MNAKGANQSPEPAPGKPFCHNFGGNFVDLAALQNFSPEQLRELAALGLTVVVLLVDDVSLSSPVHHCARLGEELGEELSAARVGGHDSSAWREAHCLHFFHVGKLGLALHELKSGLERRGLLGISHLFVAEPSGVVQEYFPGTAQTISL